MSLLNEILMKSSQHLPADGYRAGGLFIQPFSSFKKHFEKHGIIHEFSILKNAKGLLEKGEVSFNNEGVKKNIYRFSENVTEEDGAGIYTEYTLEFVQMPIVTRLLNSIFYRVFKRKANHKKYGDGIPTANKMSSVGGSKFTSTETFSLQKIHTTL